MTKLKYPRGSEWREWDLHIHSPASFEWNGEKFGTDKDRNNSLIDEMIAAMNEAAPAAFAIMDYWTFDGWFALKKRLAEPGAPKLTKTVFPGIEVRLNAPMEGRLNAHVIFSDEINNQLLKNFQGALQLELINQPLSPYGLMTYARNAGEDKLKRHGFKKAEVTSDDAIALDAGCKIAEINCDSYKSAIKAVPDGLAVGFMPFSTNDGLQKIKWAEHYAYVLSLFTTSPIFEVRDLDLWGAFAGSKTLGNATWIKNFQEALNNIPRLAVSGSDAHRVKGVSGDNNKRGYGDFPSNKKTWIKADPTWKGLLQAIKEPAKRSFIGEIPPKLQKVTQNRTFYIDSVLVTKQRSTLKEKWLDGCSLPINSDLVAIIGNKGSGKSALADIIALLGNAQQRDQFSFLVPERFRGKTGEPAKHFKGKLNWLSGDPGEMLLSENPPPGTVELVRYIPQGRFEALCNEHITGKSNAFERELRSVIFSHIDPLVSQGALDFDQLLEKQESSFYFRFGELRKTLHLLNAQIVSIEDQLHPTIRKNLEEQLRLKRAQLAEHLAFPPKEVKAPTEELTPEQKTASDRLREISLEIAQHEAAKAKNTTQSQTIAVKQKSVTNIGDRLSIFKGQHEQFVASIMPELERIGLQVQDVVTVDVKEEKLKATALMLSLEMDHVLTDNEKGFIAIEKLKEEAAQLNALLNEPQKLHEKFVAEKKDWEQKRALIEGDKTQPESKQGLEERILQITALPAELEKKRAERRTIAMQLHEVLEEQRKARAALFSRVQELIQSNELIREEYKLQFQANLQASPELISSRLFELVKQNAGKLRGEDESVEAIKSRFNRHSIKVGKETVEFIDEVISLLDDSSQKTQPKVPGIRAILRKDKSPTEVYDFLFGLGYIEPKYTLLFQETEIEQLSPGQRGALLLIFYLLVDTGRNPIVLDQPEENLDNETIVKLLVPVLNQAKENRQIIMVTHNPNLAIVCDAEQIIHATFERKNGAKISYASGSIEDGVINRAAVDILEGTKVAFKNRGDKWH